MVSVTARGSGSSGQHHASSSYRLHPILKTSSRQPWVSLKDKTQAFIEVSMIILLPDNSLPIDFLIGNALLF
jgi:hypothetical protein